MRPQPAPLLFKPNLNDAAQRWDAYYAGEIIDRPVVCVTAPKPGIERKPRATYHDRAFGDMDEILDNALHNAAATYYGGEAMPAFRTSFGPDEVAVFCGAELKWSEWSGDTNWSVPCIDDWRTAPPIALLEDHPLWQRMLAFYRRAAERMKGKMLITHLDLHTNMDILAPMRGPERLCMDLIDYPEAIDEAMFQARKVFHKVWSDVCESGQFYENGFWHDCYAMDGAETLQCDFSCMISPEMFRRWVLPALEEEAAIVKHVVYHWDGPGALVHTDDLVKSSLIQTLSYVPGAGNPTHLGYLKMFRDLQDRGKGIQFVGSPEDIKQAHRELRPEKTIYVSWCETPDEAEALLEWFVSNT